MRLLLTFLVMVCACGCAYAQDQTTPAPDATRRILIIGDQLAGGMGAGLTRMVENDRSIQVVNRFNESSGLARPEIYDWASAIPKMAEGKNFTTAFVLLGFNDRREIRDGDKILNFGSPDWDALYKARVDAVLDALAAQKIHVFWMGEPPMGDPAMDADLQNITSLQKERVVAKGAGFIELRTPFANAQGGYTDRGLDDAGTERRLRENDGVTFFKQGNNRLGQIALAALKSGEAAPVPTMATSATAALAPTPLPTLAPTIDDQGPLFGQEGVEIANAAQGSKEISVAVEHDRVLKQAASESSIGIAAVTGSNANALFTTGTSPPAPLGRFDDFTAAAPP